MNLFSISKSCYLRASFQNTCKCGLI
uniref:Uncharacterized protein n=1 Tax=Arundo donax TaxID=35708 RepID=A0A0A9AE47_ARUDO